MRTRKTILAACVLAVWAFANARAELNPSAPLTADDYAAIQQLYAQYAHGFDSKVDDGQMYVAVFTDDGAFTDQFDRRDVGAAALLERYGHTRTGKPNPISNSHSTWNVAIDPAPWGATGRAYKSNGIAFDAQRRPVPVGVPGVYYDILVKTSSGWRFRQRIFRQEFARPDRGTFTARGTR